MPVRASPSVITVAIEPVGARERHGGDQRADRGRPTVRALAAVTRSRRVLPQPCFKLSDRLARLRLLQRGQRIRQLTAQRCHQPGQHFTRRRPFITGHSEVTARECSPHAFPSPCAHPPHMHGNTQRPDAAVTSAPLLPRGDSTASTGAARHAILDPFRHR